MIAETVIYSLLNASSGLAALVGNRIYFDTRPEEDLLPAVVYELVSDIPDNVFDPSENQRRTARVQVTSIASTPEEAVLVREQVLLAAQNKSGVIAGFTVLACIDGGLGADAYDHLVDAYSKPMDFKIHYLR